jgi:hypothetical protein
VTRTQSHLPMRVNAGALGAVKEMPTGYIGACARPDSLPAPCSVMHTKLGTVTHLILANEQEAYHAFMCKENSLNVVGGVGIVEEGQGGSKSDICVRNGRMMS